MAYYPKPDQFSLTHKSLSCVLPKRTSCCMTLCCAEGVSDLARGVPRHSGESPSPRAPPARTAAAAVLRTGLQLQRVPPAARTTVSRHPIALHPRASVT